MLVLPELTGVNVDVQETALAQTGYVNSTSVTVNMSWAVGDTPVDKCGLSNDNTTFTWFDPVASRAWTLPPGDGEKTVYFKCNDTSGYISNTVYDTVILDTVKPIASGIGCIGVNVCPPGSCGWPWYDPVVGVTLNEDGLCRFNFSENATPPAVGYVGMPYTLWPDNSTSPPNKLFGSGIGQINYYDWVYVRTSCIDYAGNEVADKLWANISMVSGWCTTTANGTYA